MPTKRSDAQPLVEREKQFTVFQLRFLGAKKVNLYIMINIYCPRKRIKKLQPLTGLYVYSVYRRSENFLLLSDLLFT